MTPCYGHNTCCNRDEFSRTIFPCSVEQRIAAANQNRRVSVTPQERAYDLCNRVPWPGWGDAVTAEIAAAITEAVAAERQAIIALVDEYVKGRASGDPGYWTAVGIATAIRARGDSSGVSEPPKE